MKPISILTILSFICCSSFTAQAKADNTITGKVKDENNKPIDAVTVSLLKASDSSLVKMAFTDTSGNFEIERDLKGDFLLSYSSIGFESTYSDVFKLEENQNYSSPTVSLHSESKKIQEVTVTSRRPTIEAKPGKIVFNVEGSINATGSNALELLQKSPGVMVDNNENISMKGKSGVKIYIDGKMTQLDNKGLAEYLKSINSSDVEAIEMIANPGAKYDASGNAGVINIRLKKNKKFGTNGNVEFGLTQGRTPKVNGGASLNYRDKKINVFSNASAASGRRDNDLNIYRIQNGTIFDQNAVMTNKRRNVNVKAGADYFLDRKNTIGILATSSFGGGSFNSDGTTDIYNQSSGVLLQKLKATNNAPINRANANFNLNYRYADDSSGTQVSFDADYGLYRSTSESYQPNNYYGADDHFQYAIINGNSTPTDINIYTAKLDIEHKLGKGKLGYGAKVAVVKTDNTFEFFKYTDNVPVKDMGLSNSFVYTENVNAAYVNYDITLSPKWSLQTGLRMEQSNTEGKLTRADGVIQADNTVKRNYLNLFPNAALTYTWKPEHVFGLTYSRRIDRPDYQDLNPFENKLDQMTYEKGNAFLNPQYTDNIELSYIFKSMVNASLGYSYVKDYVVTITDTINNNATFIQNRNIASQRIYSFSIGSPLPIAKWWNGYINVWCNYQQIEGSFNNINLDLSAFGYGAYMQQSFTLGKNYTAELSGWFNGKGMENAWHKNAMGSLDIGIQKRFLNERASLKLSVTDVLRTTRFKGGSNYGGVDLAINQQNENQTVRLNFNYRFGNSQVKGARQRKTASDSEGRRIK
jgi:outer membrane receptor protein involved in Fe transport